MTPGGRRVPTAPSLRHLPDLGSVETITMAANAGADFWLAVVVTLSRRAVSGAIGQTHPPAPNWPRDRSLHR